jgi:hypothetical protein
VYVSADHASEGGDRVGELLALVPLEVGRVMRIPGPLVSAGERSASPLAMRATVLRQRPAPARKRQQADRESESLSRRSR